MNSSRYRSAPPVRRNRLYQSCFNALNSHIERGVSPGAEPVASVSSGRRAEKGDSCSCDTGYTFIRPENQCVLTTAIGGVPSNLTVNQNTLSYMYYGPASSRYERVSE